MHQGGLTHTGWADQQQCVVALGSQDAHHFADLALPAIRALKPAFLDSGAQIDARSLERPEVAVLLLPALLFLRLRLERREIHFQIVQ